MIKALLRLILAQIFVNATMGGLRVAGPLLALRSGYGPAAVGALVALPAVSSFLLAIPVGRYSSHKGFRALFLIGAVVAIVGAALSAVWPVYPVLCITMLAGGASATVATISLQHHVSRLASNPVELKQAFSWIALGPAVSNVLGPFMAGLMIDQFGFRAGFLSLAILPVLSALIVRRTHAEGRSEQAEEGAPSGSAWNLFRDRRFRNLMIVNWLLASCWDIHSLAVPILGTERGLSASAIGGILGAFSVAAVAVRLIITRAAARMEEHVATTATMLLCVLVFLIYPFQEGALSMALSSCVLGLALGTVQPMVMSTMHQITPPARHGEAIGIRMMSINASSVVMPMIFGAAGAAVGIAPVFWVGALMVGSGMPAAWRLRIPRHSGDQDKP